MLTEEQIQEIEQALKCYEDADDMEESQRARFVIELHAPDWTRIFINDIRTLQQQNKQLIEVLESVSAYIDKGWYATAADKVDEALQQVQGEQP